jgi:proteic killer suppression protein
VIKTFADRASEVLFRAGISGHLPADVVRRAVRKLEALDLATTLNDLRVPPGNRLHALSGGRDGQYAMRVNDRYRVCFRFVDGDAYDVQVTDYH